MCSNELISTLGVFCGFAGMHLVEQLLGLIMW
jgi:hypothetical protein